MIQIKTPWAHDVVHVVGSGPSRHEVLVPGRVKDGELVVSLNDAAYEVGKYLARPRVGLVHFTADFGYAKMRPTASESVGVVVTHFGQNPPPYSDFDFWVQSSTKEVWWSDDGGMFLGNESEWCGGFAAWAFADACAFSHVHLYGFDGGDRYEKFRPSLESAAGYASVPFTDHAGRL